MTNTTKCEECCPKKIAAVQKSIKPILDKKKSMSWHYHTLRKLKGKEFTVTEPVFEIAFRDMMRPPKPSHEKLVEAQKQDIESVDVEIKDHEPESE